MSHSSHMDPHHGHGNAQGDSRDAYWKNAHKDWKFWIAVVLMLTAMGVYIGTMDLALRPDNPPNAVPQTPIP